MSLVGKKARNHPQQRTNPKIDDRALPQEEFDKLHERFEFTVDAAASRHNAKLPAYWNEFEDALTVACDWSGNRVYCNVPYSNIRPWVDRAHLSTGFSLLLLPANRCEQAWWQDLIEPHRDGRGSGRITTEFWRGRTRFIAHDDDQIRPNSRPPFGLVSVIFGEL